MAQVQLKEFSIHFPFREYFHLNLGGKYIEILERQIWQNMER